MSELVDTYRRAHRTLRISVTDRCQMRCRYCLPHGAPPPLPREEILSFEEIARIVRVGATLGIERVRYTGGEPLLRRSLENLIAMTRDIAGVRSISLTTNGLLLRDKIDALVGSGLTHLSISLDSIHRTLFEEMTGTDGLATVLDAVDAARARKELSIELNCVAVRGRTENEIVPLVRFAREKDIPVRFIELMPFEDVEWSEELLLPGAALEEIIGAAFGAESYEEIDRARPAAPARRFRFRDGRSGFGLIEPVTNPFCAACDRLRLRSDGRLFNCLFGREGFDLRTPARAGDDIAIAEVFRQAVAAKGPGGMLEFKEQVENRARVMASIGG